MSDPQRARALVLVDENNRRIGLGEKHLVHRLGALHRAFSIFLLDRNGRILIQRRHKEKYHSGGLWANTCCGHPGPVERTRSAATRRLGEELGTHADLTFQFHARYNSAVSSVMRENELAYVYIGRFDGACSLDPEEIDEIDFVALSDLTREVERRPQHYAVWLRHYLSAHGDELRAAIAELGAPA